MVHNGQLEIICEKLLSIFASVDDFGLVKTFFKNIEENLIVFRNEKN